MYKCHICEIQTGGHPEHKIATIVREVNYHKYTRPRRGQAEGQYKTSTQGWEIAEEVKVCPKCYNEHAFDTPEYTTAKDVDFTETRPKPITHKR
jgi:hypothetical protein